MSVNRIKVRIHVVRDSTHAGIYQLIAAEYGRVSLGILFDKNSVNSIAVELSTSLFRGEKLIKKNLRLEYRLMGQQLGLWTRKT